MEESTKCGFHDWNQRPVSQTSLINIVVKTINSKVRNWANNVYQVYEVTVRKEILNTYAIRKWATMYIKIITQYQPFVYKPILHMYHDSKQALKRK